MGQVAWQLRRLEERVGVDPPDLAAMKARLRAEAFAAAGPAAEQPLPSWWNAVAAADPVTYPEWHLALRDWRVAEARVLAGVGEGESGQDMALRLVRDRVALGAYVRLEQLRDLGRTEVVDGAGAVVGPDACSGGGGAAPEAALGAAAEPPHSLLGEHPRLLGEGPKAEAHRVAVRELLAGGAVDRWRYRR